MDIDSKTAEAELVALEATLTEKEARHRELEAQIDALRNKRIALGAELGQLHNARQDYINVIQKNTATGDTQSVQAEAVGMGGDVTEA